MRGAGRLHKQGEGARQDDEDDNDDDDDEGARQDDRQGRDQAGARGRGRGGDVDSAQKVLIIYYSLSSGKIF